MHQCINSAPSAPPPPPPGHFPTRGSGLSLHSGIWWPRANHLTILGLTMYMATQYWERFPHSYLTNRWQFSMVYTLIDHKMTSKNVQNCGSWFHCQVLDILWRHFMVYKSIDHRKLPSICFLQQHGKSTSGIDYFFVEKACALHLTLFLLSVLL